MYWYVHSLHHSACAASLLKNPTSQPTQDVRNFQIVKEQKNLQKKFFLFFSRFFFEATCHRPRNGGARRDRTDDLLRARQALSQLSYGPLTCPFGLLPCRLFARFGHLPVCKLPRSLTSLLVLTQNACVRILFTRPSAFLVDQGGADRRLLQ